MMKHLNSKQRRPDLPSIKFTSLFSRACLVSSLAMLAACGGSGGSTLSNGQKADICNSFDCQTMLTNLADNVIIPMIEDFELKATSLNTAVTAWQAEPNNAELKAASADAWNNAMLSWQSLEVIQIGPLLSNSSLLRDSIYSWPSVSSCVVDQEVIEAESQGNSYDISMRTPLRKGLAALEYILYTPSLNHTCPETTTKTQNWNSRSDSERLNLRASFAKAASSDVLNKAMELTASWTQGSNSFRHELIHAGTNSSRFVSSQNAVNHVSDSLFYIEKQVKDMKLAEPLGLKGGKCVQGEAACADAVENPYSARSKEHIRQNLLAFQQVFLGGSGLGYDDMIDTIHNGENVSAMMEADINTALNAIDALENQSLQAAVSDINGLNLAKGIHESVKSITDRLKSDFVNILGLSIPAAAAGDGD